MNTSATRSVALPAGGVRVTPPAGELQQRMDALLAAAPTGGLVVHGSPNVQYLTGYDGAGFAPWLLIHGDRRQLVHYTADEDTFADLSSAWELISFDPSEDELEVVVRAVRRDGERALSGDTDWWTAGEFSAVAAACAEPVSDASGVLARARRRKSSWEQEQLRAAGSITQQVMETLIDLAAQGATAPELASELHARAIRLGSGPLPPTPFVAVGAATLRNHTTWDSGSQPAGPYLFEFATSRNGYGVPLSSSDTEEDEGRRALAAIQLGLRTIDDRMGPSVPATEIHRSMQSAISGAGFELRHRSGYSIGLGETDTWMEGRVGRLGPSADYVLESGMAFHVVGSVVTPRFGVAQSMSVLVTDSGIEHLAGPVSRWRTEA
jgi:Xaa-Pro dipeptidase